MRRALLASALLLAAAAAAHADRQTAEFFNGRGDKALQAKDWAGAEEQYGRALKEDASFLPARFGHAQALLALSRPAAAILELNKVVADVKSDPASPAEWKAMAAKAEKQLQEMDAAAAELQKIVDRYADDLLALARKWQAKDPEIAERSVRRILNLRPGDKAAEEILEKVDHVPKGLPLQLFNGVDLKNWYSVEFPFFQVKGNVILAESPEGSREIRSLEEFTGDYEVRVEARLVSERAGRDPMVQLMAGYRGATDYVGVGLINRKVYFVDRTDTAQKRILVKTPMAEWKAPFDPAQWATYVLRMEGDQVTALINGEVVGTDKRNERRMGGFISIYAQSATVEFRKVEVQRQ